MALFHQLLTQDNGVEYFESTEVKPIASNVKYETLEKSPTRKYNRKSKTNDKAKALIDQMIKEQTIEQPTEQSSEQSIDQPIDQPIEQTIFELLNSEGCIETRLINQQAAYRIQQQSERSEQEQLDKASIDKVLAVLDTIVEKQLSDIQTKPISERVKNAMINAVNYTKVGQQEGKKAQVTGKIIDLSLMEDDELCVIDIDPSKNILIEEIDKICQNLINNVLPPNVGLFKTAHGGLHIYCNRNGYKLTSNRCVKVITGDNFDVDIFAQMTKFKVDDKGKETDEIVQNRIVAPNTSIREMKNNQRIQLKYEAINDWANMKH
ncbi:MAG: hypothetical protein EZS28_049198, partial [Streblomastix strix]